MAEGFELGSAFVTVRPNTDTFKEDLETKLDAETKGQGVAVKVSPDAKGFEAKLRTVLDAETKGSGVKVKVSADTKSVDKAADDAKTRFTERLAGVGKAGLLGTAILEGTAALPGLAAGAAGLAGIAAGGAFLLETNKAVKKDGSKLKSALEGVLKVSTAPMIKPVEDGLKSLTGFVSTLKAPLTQVFADSGKLVMPLVSGVELLVKNLLPGFLSFMKQVGNSGGALKGIFGQVGSIIGGLFKGLAPAIGPSLQAIHNLLTAVKGLVSPLTTVVTWAAKLAAAIPPKVLTALVGGFLALISAMKVARGVMAALDVVMDANPWALIALAVIALAAVVIKYHRQILSFVEKTWGTIEKFLSKTWGTVEHDVVSAWSAVTNWLHKAWSNSVNTLHSIWSGGVNFLSRLWGDAEHDVVKAWSSIGNWLHSAWSNSVNTLKSVWNGAVNWVTRTLPGNMERAFKGVVNGIGKVWNGLKNIVSGPVSWVVDHVSSGVDAVTSKLGMGRPMGSFEHYRMAGGGVIPGYAPGRDTVGILASPGEAVIVPEAVKAIGADNIRALNYKYSKRTPGDGTGRFAGGGIIPSLWGDIKGAASATWDFLTSPAKAVGSLINDVLGGIPGAQFGVQLATGAAKEVAKAVVNWFKGSSPNINYTPGAGVKQWTPDVLRALAMLHLPASLASRVLYQMQTESGGNPDAINLWDSNAAAGDPSRGLMQVIGSTFAAYHVPGTSSNILDPLANIAAAINYAEHVYGPSLGALGSGHGYARGGNAPKGDTAWVGENGPELVRFGAAARITPTEQATGHTFNITINGPMPDAQQITKLKQQLATAVAGTV